MDGIACDRCGAALLVDADVRYVMRLSIQAAYDPLELTREDLQRDLQADMRTLLEGLASRSAEDLAREVHYEGRFDLCPPCQRSILADPLFRRESAGSP